MLKPLGIIPLIKLKDDSVSMHLGRYKQERLILSLLLPYCLQSSTVHVNKKQEKASAQAIQWLPQQYLFCNSEGCKGKKGSKPEMKTILVLKQKVMACFSDYHLNMNPGTGLK